MILIATCKHCAGQPAELSSPDGRYTVHIVDRALPHSDRIMGDSTLILSKRGQAMLEVSTTGYLVNALWSPDGRYVAVNNRRGNSGDYVWVFSVVDARIVKKPDDETFHFSPGKIRKICAECNEANLDKDLTIAKAWKSPTDLEIEMRWRFHETALIVRHAIYRVGGRKPKLLREGLNRHAVDWQPPEPGKQ